MKNLLNISQSELSQAKVVAWGYTENLEPTTFNEYLKWVAEGHYGPLNYLADYRKDKRKSLKEVYADCESALVFLFDYRKAKKAQQAQDPKFKLASYTLGFDDQDYHFWIKAKLQDIFTQLSRDYTSLQYQISLDVHPVLERDLALRAGLGWFGKNSMLINRELGSYQLIGALLLNQKLPLAENKQEVDHCGNCTACIDACPTNAILPGARTLDASRCISTFTIETFKDELPPQGYPTASTEVFGCDICQEVCPWNRKPMQNIGEATLGRVQKFFDRELKEIIADIEAMSNREYKELFGTTSLGRVGKRGLLKNLKYYLKS